jgi:hypothetical protein
MSTTRSLKRSQILKLSLFIGLGIFLANFVLAVITAYQLLMPPDSQLNGQNPQLNTLEEAIEKLNTQTL